MERKPVSEKVEFHNYVNYYNIIVEDWWSKHQQCEDYPFGQVAYRFSFHFVTPFAASTNHF